MKLFLVRHSKAIDEANTDFERKLTSEGKKLVEKVAANLILKPSFDAELISSPAFRAIETARLFSSAFCLNNVSIKEDEFLYRYHTPERFLMWLDSTANKKEIWVFGHNPMLSQIVSFLTDGQIWSMPKCAVACFESEAKSWFNVNPETTKLLFFESPKNFK